MMKRMMTLGLLVMAGVMGWAPEVQAQARMQQVGMQVKDDLLAGTASFAAGAKDVTEVNLDPRMLAMMPQKSSDVTELAHKLDFVVVRTYEYDKPGMYKTAELEAIRKRLDDGTWNCFIRVRDSKSGESTDICSRTGADHETNEMIIIAAEATELTFVHLKGRMSLGDLQKLQALGAMGAASAVSGAGPAGHGSSTRPSPPTPPTAPTPPTPPVPPARPSTR